MSRDGLWLDSPEQVKITEKADHEQLSDFCDIQVHIVVGVDFLDERDNVFCIGDKFIIPQLQPGHVSEGNFACAVLVDLLPSPPGVQILIIKRA
jgi:hypothetical protein